MRRRYNGAKTRLRSFGIAKAVGRGALYKGRSGIERNRGLYTRENAGISSARQARNLPVESLRFPGEGSSAQGKSGPKPRTESRRRWTAGGDSCTAKGALNEAVTQEDRPSGVMVNPVQGARVERSEVRVPESLSFDAERNKSSEAVDFTLARKAAKERRGARTANRHR